ncbi:Flagellar motor switch protein FliN [Buchnera aphidicola (Eriosoma lanigerum)]|uniref:flagellar motor switch protein FliN n=1 Tax=Buchnera aphidicola TaxID=9 RepID=UPI0034641CBF
MINKKKNQYDLQHNEQNDSIDTTKQSLDNAELDLINNNDTKILSNNNIDLISDVPIQISVELGTIKIPIKDFLQLSIGSVLVLDNDLDKPLNIFINNYLIAQGEIVVIENKYGIRITHIIENSKNMCYFNQ